ncbi:MAG: hypothetical protein AABZ60_17955 [Planctomycetota bacterium]
MSDTAKTPSNSKEIQTPAPKKKRKLFRKLLKLFFVFFLLGLFAVATLPLYSFLFISSITSAITTMTGRQNSIQSLSINLFGSRVSIGDLAIKEENGTEDFVHLQKAEIDFSILPFLLGRIEVPKIEISGMKTKIHKNASGAFNFDSILKQVSSSKKTPSPVPAEEKPAETAPMQKLPEVFLNLQISDIDFSFSDDQNQNSLEVQDLGFSCTIEGLNKIHYSSKLNKIQFTSKKEIQRLAELSYDLDGTIGLTLEDGQWLVASSSKFSLSPISLKGFGPQDIDKAQVELFYDLNLDMKKGNCQIQKMGMTSEYLSVLLSQINLSQLDKIQEEAAKQNQKDYTNIRQLLENLNLEDWKGALEVSLDLDQIQKTFGSYISETSKKQLTTLGGKLQLTGSLQGKSNGLIEISEKFLLDQLHLAGEIKSADTQESKPYKIDLSQIAQHFKIESDLKKRQLTTDFQWTITDDQKAQLLQIVNNSDIQKLFEDQSLLQLNKLENKIALNFEVLNHVLADFIPKTTSMKGQLDNQDTLSYKASDGLLMKGKTDLTLQVLSPESKDLPLLKITSLRNLKIGFDEKNQMNQIQIDQFNLDTQENKALSLSSAGVLNLNETQAQSILLKLAVHFKELEPYLNPFLPQIKLDGEIIHQTTIAKSQEGIKIEAEGHLNSFFVSLPDKLDYAIKETRWGSNISLGLKDNLLESVQIKDTYLTHPALEIHVQGNIVTKPEFNINTFILQTKIHAEALQKDVLSQLVARQDKEVQQKITQDLSLNGFVEFKVGIQGSPSHLSIEFMADATPLGIEFKDPQKEVLFQKKPNYNLSYKTKVDYTQKETKISVLVDSSSIQIGSVQAIMGSLLYNKEANRLSGLDGKTTVTLLDIQNFKLAEISEMLPILKKMELEESQLQFKLDEVFADLSKNNIRGKLLCKLTIPFIDLPKIQKLSQKDATPTNKTPETTIDSATTSEKTDPSPEVDDSPFKGLSESTRHLLEGIGIDVEILIQKMDVNDLNQFKDLKLAVALNKDKIDNQFHCLVQGKATSSSVDIQGLFDLSQEHPPCQFTYDIDQFPYIIEIFSPLSDTFGDVIQFPLAEKIRFADPAKVSFTLKGEDRWIGIDPRLIKKSLSSTTTACKISGGTFDLGYDLLSFMDIQKLQKEIDAQVAPLKNTLKLIQGEQTDGANKIKQIETAEAELKKKIEEVEKARQDLLKTIETLKPLAAFNPTSKSKLQEAEKKVKSYDTDLTKYKTQQNEMTGSMKKLQDQLASIQKRIEETEAKIKKAQDDFMKNMKIENPFAFNFEGISMAMDVTNEKPWTSTSSSNDLKNLAFSRVNYIEITFAPSNQNLIKITGWYSLEGSYSFSFMPSEENLAKLSQTIPGLGSIIQQQGGIIWSSDGFKPNPLSNKK